MSAVGAPDASARAIRLIATPRTRPIAAIARSRRTRSAIVARSGPASAPGMSRMSATRPTASAPPLRNATIPRPTVNVHSEVHAAPKASCARRRSRLRMFDANASRTARSRDRAAGTMSPAATLRTRAILGRPRASGKRARAVRRRHAGAPDRFAVTRPGTGARGTLRARRRLAHLLALEDARHEPDEEKPE